MSHCPHDWNLIGFIHHAKRTTGDVFECSYCMFILATYHYNATYHNRYYYATRKALQRECRDNFEPLLLFDEGEET